ncbi:MAG TPA: hypothetical protein PKO16_07555 [Bacteroidia bacterium]|jgi:hypothetical protein|nr:hypothetical protein [Bacteroidia bacterium]
MGDQTAGHSGRQQSYRRAGNRYLTAVWLNGGLLYEIMFLQLSIFVNADSLVVFNPPLRQAANRYMG